MHRIDTIHLPSASQRPTRLGLFAIVGAFAGLHLASAQTPIIERFDAGNGGFGFYGDAHSFTHIPTGGNPDGAIRAVDQNSGILWGFKASSAYLGNKSAFLGGRFSFDSRTTHGGANHTPSAADLVFVGAGMELAIDLPPLANSAWTPRSATLTASSGWRITSLTGLVPTEAEFLAVLSDLTEIRMRVEYSNSVDTGSLDNVVLEPAPTPCAAAIFCGQASIGPCTPRLDFLGYASLTNPAPFLARLDDAPTNSFAIFFYGVGARIAAPGAFGTVCVAGPHQRFAPVPSGGNPAAGPCDGTFIVDLGPHLRSGADPSLIVGANLIGHLWYRYGAAPGGAAFSEAIEAVICP